MRPSVRSLTPWVDAALSFLYPEVCQICSEQRASPAEGYVCESCAAKVRLIEPPFCQVCGRPLETQTTVAITCGTCATDPPTYDLARSAAIAKGTLLEAIHRFKYSHQRCLLPFLVKVLVPAALPGLAEFKPDLVIPVPLHWLKLLQRGFNQSELLARRLASALSVPCKTNLVRRKRYTRTQTRLGRGERRQNVRSVFAVRKDAGLTGAAVVIVDDVFTTGATADACARALKRAGASHVCVWTAARGQ